MFSTKSIFDKEKEGEESLFPNASREEVDLLFSSLLFFRERVLGWGEERGFFSGNGEVGWNWNSIWGIVVNGNFLRIMGGGGGLGLETMGGMGVEGGWP